LRNFCAEPSAIFFFFLLRDNALGTKGSEGRWLKDDQIDSGEFVKNLNAMAYYVEARKKSMKP